MVQQHEGYGFLGHEGGPDVFIHYSSIATDGYKSLIAGERVSFDIIQGQNGKPQADKVTRMNGEPQGFVDGASANQISS